MALRYCFYIVIGAALGLAGCGSRPEPLDVMCPARAVKVADANWTFMKRAQMSEAGTISAKPLNGLKGMVRQATLDRAGQAPLKVAFFNTAVRGCPWQAGQPTLTPVVIKDGMIVAVGSLMLQGLIDDGWQIREATWPWHNYQFGYIPPR